MPQDMPKNINEPSPTPHLSINVHAQYIKDLSFENPIAPHGLKAGGEPPKMDIQINLDAQPVTDEVIKKLYEVNLRLTAKAERSNEVLFIVDLLYAAAVSLPQVPEEHHHPLLLIEVPKLMFPFARKILANVTQEGGFPPLMLNPVDFQSMYMARFGKGDTTTENVAAG